MIKKPKIGISACLLGENVRYNAGHTEDRWISRTFSQYVDFFPLCPEVEMGLGIPREEIFLAKNSDGTISLIGRKSTSDYSQLATETYQRLIKIINNENLDGLILMKKSPSCGLVRVKVSCRETGEFKKFQSGLFAQAIQQAFPNLPKEDSGRLNNELLRENFIKQVFAYHRFQQIEKTVIGLQTFHKKYKYILMEHNQTHLKNLGVIAAHAHKNLIESLEQYERIFFLALRGEGTKSNRFNVMQHLAGYLKEKIDSQDKKYLHEVLEDYKKGNSSYRVPQELLRFFVHKYSIEYLQNQYYFSPYPKELKIDRVL